jgi:hypothetical protein
VFIYKLKINKEKENRDYIDSLNFLIIELKLSNMDNKILSKVKEQLLFNSEIYKKRQELIKEYVENLERITYEILGEEGKAIISKYPDVINFYDEIMIPGYYKHLNGYNGGSYGYYGSRSDSVKINIPRVIPGLDSLYKSTLDVPANEKDLKWFSNIVEVLKTNGIEVGNLCENIEIAFSGISLRRLKDYFPEAYNLYIKIKNENEKREINNISEG